MPENAPSDNDVPANKTGESPPSLQGMNVHQIIEKYLPDLIYGANDGIVTTLAIISGVVGASLSVRVILILGFANLVADGFSMGASNFLSKRTGMKASERPSLLEATRHGSATFAGFVIAGFVPLLAYLLPNFLADRFVLAVCLALLTLFVVGASRGFFSDIRWLRAGLEMLVLGALATAVAYAIGALGSLLVGNYETGI